MRKETIIIIAIGIIMGMIVAFLLITTTKEKKSEKKKIIQTKITPVVNKILKTEKKQPFIIAEPQNDFVTTDNSIILKGKAEKNSLIIAQSAYAEKAVKNNIVPDFSLNFPLTLGENIINIIAYHDNQALRIGEQVEKKILYIYYLEKEE